MRIIVAGTGWLAVRAAHLFAMLAQLAADGTEVACLPTATDFGAAGWRPSLLEAARRNGWRCHDDLPSIGLEPSDLLLSLQYDRPFRMADIGGARAANLHFAPLPRHRGSLSSYWPIACRDDLAGVTLHEMVAQVDAGPIIAARRFPLPEFATAGELYRMFHYFGFELLAAEAEALVRGSYRVRAQLDTGHAAHRRADVDFTQVEIRDFDRPARDIRDTCLALTFPEFQRPTFRGRHIQRAYVPVVTATQLQGHQVGEVVATTGQATLVRCADGLVAIEFVP